jgi:hypothetical protein
MTKRLLLLAVLLTLPLSLGPIIIQSGGEAAGNYINDPFTTDTEGTLWTEYGAANWRINQASSGRAEKSSGTGVFVYDGEELSTTSDDGRGCIQDDDIAQNTGIKFRMDSTDSNRSYTVRTTGSTTVAWRHCAVANCTDIETDSYSFSDTDCLCVQWAGSGSSTTVKWWRLAAADCPAGESSTTTDWDNDATGSGTFTNDPPTGTYPELDGGSGQHYTGIYDGGSSTAAVEEFWVWED